MTGTKKKPGDSKANVVRGAPSLAPKAIEAETVAVEGVEADFLAFITEARAIDAAKVTSFRGDPSLAYHNVVAGLDTVLAERESIVASGFKVDWRALEEMPRIALGLVFASEQVEGSAGDNSARQTDLARGRVLRDIALSSVTSLANSGALPADSASKLKGSVGPLNLGKLLVKISAFFNKHRDAVKGMTPFKADLVREAAEIGARLVKTSKPAGALASKSKGLSDAQRDRDAFAALLSQRFDLLDRAGGSRWGRSVGEHVPALQSRVRGVAKPRAKKPGPPVDPVKNPT